MAESKGSSVLDFQDVKSVLEGYCVKRGPIVFFLPKLRPELNPVEQRMGRAKRHHHNQPVPG